MTSFRLLRTRTHSRTTSVHRSVHLRLTGLLALALSLVVGSVAHSSPALAHDELVGFDVVTATDGVTATGVSLQFSSDIIEVGTEMIATDEAGTNVLDGMPVVDGRIVTQAFRAPLGEGRIDLAWRVVSSDGHPISGAFSLTIAPDGSGTLTETAIGETASTETAAAAPETESTASTLPGWVWTAVAVGALGVVAAVGALVIIGSRRRTDTLGQVSATADAPPHTD